jgi:hypothetical protein
MVNEKECPPLGAYYATAKCQALLVGSAISGCGARKGADRRLANIAVRFDGSQSMIRKSVQRFFRKDHAQSKI